MSKIVIFCFAGRKKYLDIQIDYILQLLNDNVNIEYHLWNFSRNNEDNIYLQELVNLNDRIKIFNDFYEGDNTNVICNKRIGVICSCTKCRVGKWTEPYKYYKNKIFENTTFIKLDDDVIFISIDKINKFVESIHDNPNKIISSNVINNGVCAFYNDDIKNIIIHNNILHNYSSLYEFWYLCTNKMFFNLSHDYFIEKFNNNQLNLENKLIYTNKTRFSINTIGFTYDTICKIANLFHANDTMNDEGIISDNFDICICNAFMNVHFHFSDQRTQITDEEELKYLKLYKDISNKIKNNF